MSELVPSGVIREDASGRATTLEKTLTVPESSWDYMEVMVRGDTFYFDIENEWAGDTETGFGRTCHVTLKREDARRLRDFLTDWLGTEIEA